MTLLRTILVAQIALWGSVVFAQPTATVVRSGNLRSTPSSARAPIRQLTRGETVTLITVSPVNGYYHIRTTQGERGWVYRASVKLGVAPSAPPAPVAPPPQAPAEIPIANSAGACGPGTEVVVDQSCPAVGTHAQNHQAVPYGSTTDAGLRNMAKRHVPDARCVPKPLTLDDVRSMQNYIDNTYADARTTKTQFAPTRNLRNISTFEGTRSEGDLVALVGYFVIARDEHAESVNCGGVDGVDIHLNVGPKSAHPNEFDGVVAEMIPQLPRPTGWDSTTLNRLAGRQVLVVGGLTYDNEHLVNDNSASPKKGQPARFSLWEIHPITEFYVCLDGDGCDPKQRSRWQTLTEWATANPVVTSDHEDRR